MEMMYIPEIKDALTKLKTKSIMVLATSLNDFVTARNMSVITVNDKIYCQTDKNMIKSIQINENPNVAYCIDNIQITGKAKIIGTWEDNKNILAEYKLKHNNSYEKYKRIKDEVVIETIIEQIQIWEYKDGKPYIIKMNLVENTFASKEFRTE